MLQIPFIQTRQTMIFTSSAAKILPNSGNDVNLLMFSEEVTAAQHLDLDPSVKI